MTNVVVVTPEGQERAISAEPGLSLMEILQRAGLPVKATCGGSLACATCHVIIGQDYFHLVGPPSEDEEDMLDQGFNVTRTSRLSCQIAFSEALAGLRLSLPIK